MNRIMSFGKKYKDRLWFAVLINAVFLGLILLAARPEFETEDDEALLTLFSGAFGTADAYSGRAGFLFGVLITSLYRISGSVCWYTFILYLFLFLGLTGVVFVILKRFSGWPAMVLVFAVLSFFGAEGYFSVCYIRTSACVTACGSLLVFDSAVTERLAIRENIAGFLLILSGFAIMPKESTMVLVCVLPGCLFLLLTALTKKNGPVHRGVLRCLIGFAPALMIVIVLTFLEHAASGSTPERRDLAEFTEFRGILDQRGFPDYAKYQDTYESLGISRSEWSLYADERVHDPEKLSPESLKTIIGLQTEKPYSREAVKAFLKQHPEKKCGSLAFLIWVFLTVVVLLYDKPCWPVYAADILQLLVIIPAELYLGWAGVFEDSFVQVGIWSGFSAVQILMLDEKRFQPDRRLVFLLMAAMLIFGQKSWRGHYRRLTSEIDSKLASERDSLASLSEDKSDLFICTAFENPISEAFRPFDRISKGDFSNILPLGGWLAVSGPVKQAYAAAGISDPCRDSMNNEKVLILSSDIRNLRAYLKEQYSADCTEERKLGGKKKLYSVHQ